MKRCMPRIYLTVSHMMRCHYDSFTTTVTSSCSSACKSINLKPIFHTAPCPLKLPDRDYWYEQQRNPKRQTSCIGTYKQTYRLSQVLVWLCIGQLFHSSRYHCTWVEQSLKAHPLENRRNFCWQPKRRIFFKQIKAPRQNFGPKEIPSGVMNDINTLRPRQDGRHFPDDIFKCNFLNEDIWVSIKIPLKLVPSGPITGISSLVQTMACRLAGAQPLYEPMPISLLTHICVTRPRRVKTRIHHTVSQNFRSLIAYQYRFAHNV